MRTQLFQLGALFWLVGAGLLNATTYYVNLNNPSPAPPYMSWNTAANDIQSAVNLTTNGDLVLVTNGVYVTGGLLVSGDSTTNRVAITNQITVQSINGPAVTVIQGYQMPGVTNGANSIRCTYMVSGSMLSGFTLTGGATTTTSYTGGGVMCPIFAGGVVSNCMIVNNWAYYDAGGAYSCTLYNCTVSGNHSQSNGGGVMLATLVNCVVSGNSSGDGGGGFQCGFFNCIISNNQGVDGGGGYNSAMYNCLVTGNFAAGIHGGGAEFQGSLQDCTVVGNQCGVIDGGKGGGSYNAGVNNCIVYYNSGNSSANCYGGTVNYCCTTPLPASGTGNFNSAPLFVNQGGGDYHLQSNSPCINAGYNGYINAATTTDLDGNPRIVDGTVDVGAYEYQTPASAESYAWLLQYGLPTDGSADNEDLDGTGMTVYEDWVAGLNPTNSASVLAMMPNVTNRIGGLTVSWQSVNTRTYYLQRASDLVARPAFSAIQSNIVGQAGRTSFTDATATNGGPYFYRVGVQ